MRLRSSAVDAGEIATRINPVVDDGGTVGGGSGDALY